MAFPTIPEKYLEDEFPKKTLPQKVEDTVVVAASKISGGASSFLDFLIVLVAAFWYFFFTGIAIVLNRKLPVQWLRLGTHLGMSRVTSLIKNASQNPLQKVIATKNEPKRQFKVVDIDTKRPFKPMKVSK